MATHHLDDTQPHAFWDNSYPARLRILPGDTVVFETLEASAGQVGPDSASEVVRNLNFDLIHPLTGPVYVEGAQPGDALSATDRGHQPGHAHPLAQTPLRRRQDAAAGKPA